MYLIVWSVSIVNGYFNEKKVFFVFIHYQMPSIVLNNQN